MIKIGTDCSGIEAPIQALIRLGVDFEHVFSSDIDKHVKKVSESIYKPSIFYDDLMLRDNTKAPRADIYIAGFPCQTFSIAGKRKGFDDVRGTVFFGCADYIRQQQPCIFILENVKGILSHDNGTTLKTINELLSGNGGTHNGQLSFGYYDDGLGYHIYTQILNTKNYGIPQNRERWFCIGFKEPRNFRFPKPFPLKLRLKDLLQSEVDEKYYLSDKAITRLTNKNEGYHSEVNEKLDLASTLCAGDHKLSRGMNILKEPSLQKVGDLQVTIKKRSHDTPKEINQFLRDNKNGLSIDKIRLALDLPKTQVEHYFRTDKSRAVPSPEVWMKLKELLKFSNEYDEAVTDVYEKEMEFESSRRVYSESGISPTLDTSADKYIHEEIGLKQIASLKEGNPEGYRVYDSKGIACSQKAQGGGLGTKTGLYNTDSRIRRLTPLECLRLQDFPDELYHQLKELEISDTQIYRMAGNSMSCNVMELILKQIFKVVPNGE